MRRPSTKPNTKMKISVAIQGASMIWVGWRIESVASRRTMPHIPIQLMPSGGGATWVSFVVMRLHHHMSAAGGGKIRPLETTIVQKLRLRSEARDLSAGDDRDRPAEMLDLLEIVGGEEDGFSGTVELLEEAP